MDAATFLQQSIHNLDIDCEAAVEKVSYTSLRKIQNIYGLIEDLAVNPVVTWHILIVIRNLANFHTGYHSLEGTGQNTIEIFFYPAQFVRDPHFILGRISRHSTCTPPLPLSDNPEKQK